ncbi:MAG: BlaI/MecI/CopY family transcriptional regulator [Salinivirgaceae bacterium]|jgi:BlaI family penicillinase repressor|nr:BlaI/MecI/CopY family transcriptional regulator [Salinivirgaceae bacterium]
MTELTKAEEQIMQQLWSLKNAFVKDIVDQLPQPKPAYNTVSTIVRILEKKGFVAHDAFGKSHRYYPLVSKKTYTRGFMKGFLNNYFSNSFKNLVSFFAKDKSLSIAEMEELKNMLEVEIERQKNNA